MLMHCIEEGWPTDDANVLHLGHAGVVVGGEHADKVDIPGFERGNHRFLVLEQGQEDAIQDRGAQVVILVAFELHKLIGDELVEREWPCADGSVPELVLSQFSVGRVTENVLRERNEERVVPDQRWHRVVVGEGDRVVIDHLDAFNGIRVTRPKLVHTDQVRQLHTSEEWRNRVRRRNGADGEFHVGRIERLPIVPDGIIPEVEGDRLAILGDIPAFGQQRRSGDGVCADAIERPQSSSPMAGVVPLHDHVQRARPDEEALELATLLQFVLHQQAEAGLEGPRNGPASVVSGKAARCRDARCGDAET